MRENRRITELRADFQQQLRELQRQLEDKGQELKSLAAGQDTLRSLATVRAERIRELEAELARKDEAFHKLQAELDAARVAPADPTDDLTRMRGIGPKFASRLHEIGITRFAQIAAWTEVDVAEMATRLNIHPGRIARDRWVEGARELAGLAPAAPAVEDEPTAETEES